MQEEQSFLSLLQQLPLPAQREVYHASELAYYQAVYTNFTVLLHDFQTENLSDTEKENTNLDYEQIEVYFSEIEEKEQKRILNLVRFLQIKYSENSTQNKHFRTYCEKNGKSSLSRSDRSELKKRIEEITKNPEIGVSGADVIKNLEAKIGRKIQISP
ncbi:MAG: hypothetical protein H7A25_23110 [Leptospiraceae bacterium]|nr:hypothetical protein [Leptospiraceae bacterium]